MRVVLGGMASRHALPVDRLDDLQLAVETLFREEAPSGEDLTLTLSVQGDTFKVALAGLSSPLVRRGLCGTSGVETDNLGAEKILCMIMDALVDRYVIVEGATVGSFVVEMEKLIVPVSPCETA